MRHFAVVAFVTIACGPVAAHAQTLALTYESGDTYKYALHSSANESIDAAAMAVQLKLDITAKETVTVKSVDSSGTAVLSIDLSNVVVKSVTGQMTTTTTGMPMPTIDMKIAADGRILSVNGNAFGGNPFTLFTGMGGGFISAVLPNTAVKPGDTWSKDFDQANPLGTGTIHVTTTSKYLRDESLQGVNAAVVETTSIGSVDISIDMSRAIAGQSVSPATTIPPGMFQSLSIKGTMTSETITWVDPSGHRVLKTHSAGASGATMTFAAASGPVMPGLAGPIAIKTNETTDLSLG